MERRQSCAVHSLSHIYTEKDEVVRVSVCVCVSKCRKSVCVKCVCVCVCVGGEVYCVKREEELRAERRRHDGQ